MLRVPNRMVKAAMPAATQNAVDTSITASLPALPTTEKLIVTALSCRAM